MSEDIQKENCICKTSNETLIKDMKYIDYPTHDYRWNWEKLGLTFKELLGCQLHGDWDCKELRAMTTPPVKPENPTQSQRQSR